MKRTGFSVITSVPFLVGCVPFHYTDRPEVQGQVLDGGGNGVEGARITLQRVDEYMDPSTRLTHETVRPPVAASVTGKGGFFFIPEQTHWGVWVMPGDMFNEGWRITASRPGFISRSANFWASIADQHALRSFDINLGCVPATQ